MLASKSHISSPPDDQLNIGLTPLEIEDLKTGKGMGSPLTTLTAEQESRIDEVMKDYRYTVIEKIFTKMKDEKTGEEFWPSEAYTGVNETLESIYGPQFSKFLFLDDYSGRVLFNNFSDLNPYATIVESTS